jgi:hypothetical protein
MKERATSDETALRKTQRWLASAILQPERLDEAGFGPEAADLLVAPPAGDVVARLRAYTGGYPARIAEAVEEAFPALTHVIGHARLHELLGRYLPHVVAGIYNLNDVGGSLPAFVAGDAIAREFPFAPDLAELERAVQRAFHAREKPPFDPAAMAGWTMDEWSSAVLAFQPSVAVVTSKWPIRDIWAARETPVEEIDIELEGRPDRVLVHRAEFQVVCESISDDEAAALRVLLAGTTLGHMAEQLGDEGRDPSSVAQWFARWNSRGLVAGCSST